MVYDPDFGYQSSTDNETFRGITTYTYEKNVIILEIKWQESQIDEFDDGKWSGTVDEKTNTMTLENVFGENVTFKK